MSVDRTNVALPANGAAATASSIYSTGFPASAVINGDRKGTNWGNGGGWHDGTGNNYPDWVQISFNGSKSINEIDVFTVQDNYSNPSEPTEQMTFATYGLTDYQVQYWNGSSWVNVPGGNITGNNKVWRKLTFSDISTDKIRVNVTGALASYSRIIEIEAYQSTATYLYDAAGNVTWDGMHSYQYDAENRLVSVDGGMTAQYRYDHQNRRVSKIVGSSWTHYIWEGGQVVSEHDATTPYSASYALSSARVDYVHHRGTMVYSRQRTSSTGAWTERYYVSDRWSTRLVLDTSGNVTGRQAHLPFGEEFAESGIQEKHHFTNYEAEIETGTDYAVNRQYSQSVGRFGSADPYQASSYMVDPQSWNRYSYVQNDPIHNVDPLGLLLAAPGWDPCSGGPPSDSDATPGTQARTWWTGFNDNEMNDIEHGLEAAEELLTQSACARGLRSRQFGGRTIDVDALFKLLLTIRVKPDSEDPTTHGGFKIFNGQTSTHPAIVAERVLGQSGGAILGDLGPNADIFLFAPFFNARGGARIDAVTSRAVALIHEAIHLQGFRDRDFTEGSFRGSAALSTFIIHSCFSTLLDHNDLSIVVQ